MPGFFCSGTNSSDEGATLCQARTRKPHSLRATLFGDSNHDLPVTLFFGENFVVRVRCLIEWNYGVNKSLESSGVKQLRNCDQLFLVRFDDEEGIFYALVRCAFAGRGDRYQASFRL